MNDGRFPRAPALVVSVFVRAVCGGGGGRARARAKVPLPSSSQCEGCTFVRNETTQVLSHNKYYDWKRWTATLRKHQPQCAPRPAPPCPAPPRPAPPRPAPALPRPPAPLGHSPCLPDCARVLVRQQLLSLTTASGVVEYSRALLSSAPRRPVAANVAVTDGACLAASLLRCTALLQRTDSAAVQRARRGLRRPARARKVKPSTTELN